MVLVEYLEDHEACSGLPDEDDKAFTIEEGTQRYVDARSAKSLVKKGKVKLVDVEVDAPEPEASTAADGDDADDDSDDDATDSAVTSSSSWSSSGAN
jgi:hypothetical protein